MKDDHIIVGRFGSPHGVRGWIKVQSFTKPLDNLLDYDPWFVVNKGVLEELPVEDIKVHSASRGDFVVKLSDIDDRDIIALYTNKDIAIMREQLPTLEENEYYWDDLVGLKVIDQHNQELGIIDHLMETGANDVIVIIKDNKETLIPFLMGSVIKSISLEEKVMHVDWEMPV